MFAFVRSFLNTDFPNLFILFFFYVGLLYPILWEKFIVYGSEECQVFEGFDQSAYIKTSTMLIRLWGFVLKQNTLSYIEHNHLFSPFQIKSLERKK